MQKPLAIGIDDYKEIKQNYYYVDKTLLIKDIIDSKGAAILFTRPRRFGKTLALSMLRTFFEKEYGMNRKEVDKRPFFEGLNILNCEEKYTEQMGQYPVISLSLKSAKQGNFELSYGMLKRRIAEEFKRHSYALNKIEVAGDRERYEEIMNERGEELQYADALAFLSRILYQVHGRKTIILIDEYDVPLENAWFAGFYQPMVDFIRSLFESALKTNESLEFAVITGCLRITKESIFTGLNNLEIISVLNDNYAEYFGFTQSEVSEMLRVYGIQENEAEVKKWYDGYRFGQIEVYNPWSVINYVKTAVTNVVSYPKPYWSNTSSNSIIRELVENADGEVKQEIEKLIEGGTIEKPVHEEITYEDIHRTQDNLWNFLFFTGYLKKISEQFEERTIWIKLAIPNEEVKYIYENVIMDWFREEIKKEDLSKLYHAFEEEDCETAANIISDNLARTISFYDYAETFYHGFMLGMFSQASDYIVKSNREAGNGRLDIVMKSPSRRGLAVIFELKIAVTMDELEQMCQEGLRQIEEKGYAKELQDDGYRKIKKYGIAFYKKDCEVMCGDCIEK